MINVPQPSLNTALQELFVDKRLPRERGEFARIIIIHGIYARIWDVSRYLEDPLSHWTPTAYRQISADLLPKTPVWLPAIPAYVKWQNSACDALDVLHWQANATIGLASGLEHPTVLHLHIARVVLLTPYDKIVSLARHTAKGTADTETAKADQQNYSAMGCTPSVQSQTQCHSRRRCFLACSQIHDRRLLRGSCYRTRCTRVMGVRDVHKPATNQQRNISPA